jgi:hypothetical protein
VSAAGQKKGIFGRVRAKAGQRCGPGAQSATIRPRNCSGIRAAGVSRTERCYEPARANFVVAIPGRDAAIPMPPGLDHDLVIGAF